AVAEVPALMVPGADDQIIESVLIRLLVLLVCLDGTVEILRVEPPAHVQRRDGHRLNVWQHAAHVIRPVPIEVGMRDEGVPTRHLAMKYPAIDIREWAQLQEAVVL